MQLREVVGDRNLSDTLTKLVKTEALLRHIHRFNMITTRDHVFKIASIFAEGVQDESSAFTDHVRVRSSASCCDTTFMLPFQCFAAHSSETSDDQLRGSAPESAMSTLTMESTILKQDVSKEKAKAPLGMYVGLPTEEKQLLLYQAAGKCADFIKKVQMTMTSPGIFLDNELNAFFKVNAALRTDSDEHYLKVSPP